MQTPYWTAAIEVARANLAEGRGYGFTADQEEKAEDWQTCACGNQDPRIPRDSNGMPLDVRLRMAGWAFWAAVQGDDVEAAAVALDQVEREAARVLASVDFERAGNSARGEVA